MALLDSGINEDIVEEDVFVEEDIVEEDVFVEEDIVEEKQKQKTKTKSKDKKIGKPIKLENKCKGVLSIGKLQLNPGDKFEFVRIKQNTLFNKKVDRAIEIGLLVKI